MRFSSLPLRPALEGKSALVLPFSALNFAEGFRPDLLGGADWNGTELKEKATDFIPPRELLFSAPFLQKRFCYLLLNSRKSFNFKGFLANEVTSGSWGSTAIICILPLFSATEERRGGGLGGDGLACAEFCPGDSTLSEGRGRAERGTGRGADIKISK